ncbi:hypothetical protein BOQ62_01295 [Chryseobacterium sp. CH21]|nr:hypothetical protein BOQ62_01295 [Chryseobacterium sp. CH21]
MFLMCILCFDDGVFILLIDEKRHEIIAEMGDGFNFFNHDIWTYKVGKTWLGKRIILSVVFSDN